jgi:hypothetical protein
MSRIIPAVVVACGLLAGPAAAADAKYVKLVHADTGKVLAVADNSDEAGAKAVLAKDDGSKGQQWKLLLGRITLAISMSGKVCILDAPHGLGDKSRESRSRGDRPADSHAVQTAGRGARDQGPAGAAGGRPRSRAKPGSARAPCRSGSLAARSRP